MVNLSQVTPEQEFIIARHSRMVGKVLDLIEASIPEGTQKNDDMEKFFRKSMHDAGLSQKQAQAMYKSYGDFSGQFAEKQTNTTVDMEKQWDTDIRQEFGLPPLNAATHLYTKPRLNPRDFHD